MNQKIYSTSYFHFNSFEKLPSSNKAFLTQVESILKTFQEALHNHNWRQANDEEMRVPERIKQGRQWDSLLNI